MREVIVIIVMGINVSDHWTLSYSIVHVFLIILVNGRPDQLLSSYCSYIWWLTSWLVETILYVTRIDSWCYVDLAKGQLIHKAYSGHGICRYLLIIYVIVYSIKHANVLCFTINFSGSMWYINSYSLMLLYHWHRDKHMKYMERYRKDD